MRPRSTVAYALWLGGLLILLGGLFGMHGLDNHGGAGMDSAVSATMTGSTGHAGSVADEVITRAAPHVALVTGAATVATERPGMDMGAAGMCMAFLSGSDRFCCSRLHASRLQPPLWLVARPARSPGVRGRDPDPPSLFRLSIQRC